MNKSASICSALLLAFCCACGGSGTSGGSPPPTTPITPTPAVAVTAIAIPNSASMLVGATRSLAVSVDPSNATNKSLSWTSSDTTVATVSTTGVVTGVKAGTVNITAKSTDGSNITSNVCAMAVNPSSVLIAEIAIPNSASMAVGATRSLAVSVDPSNATNQTLSWSSSDTTVATVSAAGVITGVKAGTTNITAKAMDGSNITSNACAMTVSGTSVPITGITLPSTVSGMVGFNTAVTASISPSGATNQTLSWSSSDTTVATVSATGVVTGLKAGTANITAKSTDGSNITSNACAVTIGAASGTPWLYTKPNSNKIYVNPGSGETVWMGRGVNMDDLFMGGYNNNLSMADPATEMEHAVAKLMADWKPNFIRISLSMNSYTAVSWLGSGNVARYRTPMETLINAIGAYPNTYVLVCLRSDTSMKYSDITDSDDARCLPTSATDAVYQALVDSFHDKPHVIFGVSNEPGGNSESDGAIASAMSHAVDVIRAREATYGSSQHIVAVQGNSWTSKIDFYSTSPLAQNNVVYEYHGYPPDITGAYGYTFSNIPVIIGEYGGANYAGFGQTEAGTYFADWEAKQIPNLAWCFSPWSDVAPDLLNVTWDGNDIQPNEWGKMVKAYLNGSVLVSPSVASVAKSTTQSFEALIPGVSSAAVTWSVQESGGGAIDATGMYTAPATVGGPYHILATSQADPSKTGTATITIIDHKTAWDPKITVRNDGTEWWFTVALTLEAGETAKLQLLKGGTWSDLAYRWVDSGKAIYGGSMQISAGTTLQLRAVSSDTTKLHATTVPFTYAYGTAITPALQ